MQERVVRKCCARKSKLERWAGKAVRERADGKGFPGKGSVGKGKLEGCAGERVGGKDTTGNGW